MEKEEYNYYSMTPESQNAAREIYSMIGYWAEAPDGMSIEQFRNEIAPLEKYYATTISDLRDSFLEIYKVISLSHKASIGTLKEIARMSNYGSKGRRAGEMYRDYLITSKMLSGK